MGIFILYDADHRTGFEYFISFDQAHNHLGMNC